ncbi:hypothetical protein V8J36_11220 [Frigidibacter sp. MR17.14]|uniref:hypothetical protein n=1 Tax=Frigidibacter sp. MR17.14 TaxID=3126509 RepID=UPI003012CD92
MPALVRLYIRSAVLGTLLAAVFTALLIGFDVAGLRHLVTTVRGGWIAVGMMILANAVVFGGVQFAIALARIGEGSGPDQP